MKEHRCPKCNKLLFKYTDDMSQGKLEVETQHHCRSEDNTKVKDIKVFDNKQIPKEVQNDHNETN